MARVTAILAQLSRTVIDDNWANKPIGSLASIYCCWMPQTAAPLTSRCKALELLVERYPDIGWQICMDQFGSGPRTGHYAYRPRWRSDASGAGQPLETDSEISQFCNKALDLALAWPEHGAATLGDLVERLDDTSKPVQVKIWNLVDEWASEPQTSDSAKANLRERIRRFALTRRGRLRGLEATLRQQARFAYTKLEPRDCVVRHGWLFASQWIQESADELDDDTNFAKREDRIHSLRIEALNEVWSDRGFDGIVALLADSAAAHTVGHYAGLCVPDFDARSAFLRRSLSIHGELEEKADACMLGFIGSVDAVAREPLLRAVSEGADVATLVRMFKCAPFAENTWRMLDAYAAEIRAQYWQEVWPHWNRRHTDAELCEIVDRLLEVQRPRAAFLSVHMEWARLETSRLTRLLTDVATVAAEASGTFQMSSHDISEALDELDGRSGITPDIMAQMEFRFIGALNHSEHGIPNLERQIAKSPLLFMQAVALLYKRTDDREDPPEWRIDEPERRAAVASAMYRLLDQMKRIPGTDDQGKVVTENLRGWLAQVRQLATQHARTDTIDNCLGQLLAKAPAGDDAAWPCGPVCDAMEGIASRELARGFIIGVHNRRGAHFRGEGGGQERALAVGYRGWSQQLAFD